ncbi:MAG TPA: 4Fe-4S dicluster domain-containing protein [Candidatus Polarisedimenticolia bacterium]|nr:4Fe-4S dicluster domain-containing protein [Candidatus Polarisedimenticolia bacterium]
MAQWGMTIDLDRCDGCSSCVVACQAENNIPVAGPEAASRGAAIAWIRIERRIEGTWPDVRMRSMPALCQHCDDAPCVPACPVSATYEEAEGLNVQVYSRCVGLRFCAGACPYAVRFVNFIDPVWDEPLASQLNPDVPLREAGHIEKCTFCVQRIRRARQRPDDRGRPPGESEVAPACAQSCPTQAIVFGDLDDAGSRVAKSARDARAFRHLEEAGTGPRVIYLRDARGPGDAS